MSRARRTADASGASAETEEVQASWHPMIVIAMGQMLMSFNVAALPVSMSGMVIAPMVLDCTPRAVPLDPLSR